MFFLQTSFSTPIFGLFSFYLLTILSILSIDVLSTNILLYSHFRALLLLFIDYPVHPVHRCSFYKHPSLLPTSGSSPFIDYPVHPVHRCSFKTRPSPLPHLRRLPQLFIIYPVHPVYRCSHPYPVHPCHPPCATNKFSINCMFVIGPVPPGTGVIAAT